MSVFFPLVNVPYLLLIYHQGQQKFADSEYTKHSVSFIV